MPVVSIKSLIRRFVHTLDTRLSGNSIHFRQIVAITVPLLVDQSFIVLTSLLNTAMISSSGEAAVAAVSMIDALNIFLLNVFVALSTGGTVIVAQYKGAGHDKNVPKAAAQAVSAVAIAALVISIAITLLRGPLVSLLFGKAAPDVLDNAQIYLLGSVLSYPFIGIVDAVCGALRGVGETRSSLLLSLLTNGSYLLLNVLFINILQMGVVGLVTSLVIARVFGMLCALIYMLKIHKTLQVRLKDLITLNLNMLRKIFLIGIPFAAEQIFFNGGKLLTQTFIVELGTDSQTIYAISSSISAMFQIGASACSLAVIPVVGQCIGNRNVADARKSIRVFQLLSIGSFLVIEAILLPLLNPLIGLFSPSPQIVSTIKILLWEVAIVDPLIWSASFVTPAALRAAGDAKFTSVTALLTMWSVRVVLGYVLGIVLGFGITGVWSAMIIEWFVRALLFQLRLRSDKWYRHQLVD